jgi:alkanesulfonate monooxygenase SsuD/methylene tetrahydromethanopterin reductase-like flavin-dependent oxidoreductase (luciferase family)
MRLGVRVLPSEDWRMARHTWQFADELGFAHAWTYDHLVWRERIGRTWYAAMPTLSAAAAITSRVRLGTLVVSPNFRHPVPFAKEVATLSDISGGRFILGLGAGGGGYDDEILGGEPWSRAVRSARFAEFVELTYMLLRQPITCRSGRYYSARSAYMDPEGRSRARVPVAVAASGPRGMVVAARHADIWITNGLSPEPGVVAPSVDPAMVKAQIRALSRICEEQDRDPRGIRKLVHLGQDRSLLISPGVFDRTIARYREIGVTDLVLPLAHDAGQAERKIIEEIAGTHCPESH